MIDWIPDTTADNFALLGACIALGALLVSLRYSFAARRQSLRVEQSQAYLALEVASSDVFKYEAEKADLLLPFTAVAPPRNKDALATSKDAKIAYNLYFQTLNLMEVCTRFRRQDIIEHQVFASWVAWCYDTLDDWYFRDQWGDFRGNYTDDVCEIFDIGIAIFEQFGDSNDADVDAARKACFYEAVAKIMDCEEIAGWLEKTKVFASNRPHWQLWLQDRMPCAGSATVKTVAKSRASSRASSAATRATSATAKSSAG